MDEERACRIADAYSLAAAAALICDGIPSRVIKRAPEYGGPYYDTPEDAAPWEASDQAFQAVLAGLTIAARRGSLKSDRVHFGEYTHVRMVGNESEGYWEAVGDLDPFKTTVSRDDLIAWLEDRGATTGFFFPKEVAKTPAYMVPGERYAPQLAAAVKVWQAMEDENLRRGKGLVEAMKDWLGSRYKELGLVHERDHQKNGTKVGDPNKEAIERIAKVANWDTGGGAPKTPGNTK